MRTYTSPRGAPAPAVDRNMRSLRGKRVHLGTNFAAMYGIGNE